MTLIVCCLLVLGLFFIGVAALGVLRLPDFFCRAHALTKAMTLGISLVLLAAWIHLGVGKIGVKIFVAIAFQYLTLPLSGHIISKVAFEKNIPRWKHRAVDDHRV